MPDNKQDRDSEYFQAERTPSTLRAAETLRNAAHGKAKAAKGEDRISVFWRVFGGTILSIVALVCLTLYQQLTSSLSDLRANLNHLNESRGDFVKADDFNNRLTSVWNGIKDMQAEKANVTALKERSALLEQQVKTAEVERKELTRELQQLRERLAVQEARLATAPARPPADH